MIFQLHNYDILHHRLSRIQILLVSKTIFPVSLRIFNFIKSKIYIIWQIIKINIGESLSGWKENIEEFKDS